MWNNPISARYMHGYPKDKICIWKCKTLHNAEIITYHFRTIINLALSMLYFAVHHGVERWYLGLYAMLLLKWFALLVLQPPTIMIINMLMMMMMTLVLMLALMLELMMPQPMALPPIDRCFGSLLLLPAIFAEYYTLTMMNCL